MIVVASIETPREAKTTRDFPISQNETRIREKDK
jgi:hypothetical protein